MANPKLIYTPSGTEELKRQYIRDVRLAAVDAGVVSDLSIGPGSDVDLDATASANLAFGAVRNVALAAQDASILDATGDALDRKRQEEGLPVVAASGGSGKVRIEVSGSTTVPNGLQGIYPNGVRGVVVGTYINPSDNSEVNFEASETGEKTNLASGETIRWINPPVNLGSEATVSDAEPITGGTDDETDERKRERILNKRRNLPAGGNWAYQRQLILDNLGGIQDSYQYPALGGPASAKIVPVKDFDDSIRDWSRAPSSTQLQRVRQLLWANNSLNDNIVVNAPTDQEANFTLLVSIPDSALSGGNGLGWIDQNPWPDLVGADSNVVTVTSYSGLVLTVGANTTTSPTAGQTTIAWYAGADKKFYTALVTAVSGSSGAWVLTLDRPLLDQDGNPPQSGDYICPAARNLDGYAKEWLNIFRALGPGENTTDVGRLPRAKRHPFVTDEDPSDISNVTVTRLTNAYPEITSWSFGVSATTTPTVPSDADDAPSILVPGKFAIYES